MKRNIFLAVLLLLSLSLLSIQIVLAAPISEGFSKSSNTSRLSREEKRCLELLNYYAVAICFYAEDFGSHPDSLETLVPKYLKRIEKCPIPGRQFVYRSKKDEFEIFCASNREPLGETGPSVKYSGKGPLLHPVGREIETVKEVRIRYKGHSWPLSLDNKYYQQRNWL